MKKFIIGIIIVFVFLGVLFALWLSNMVRTEGPDENDVAVLKDLNTIN